MIIRANATSATVSEAGAEFGVDLDEVDEVFRAVAARSLAEDDFAEWLREHVRKGAADDE
jgi:prophage maintenance system killer protein